MVVGLRKNSRRKNFYIHRLVAEHFLVKISGKDVVNHKDYDTKNNIYTNLEWVSQKENVKYSIIHMRRPHNVKDKQSRKEVSQDKEIYNN